MLNHSCKTDKLYPKTHTTTHTQKKIQERWWKIIKEHKIDKKLTNKKIRKKKQLNFYPQQKYKKYAPLWRKVAGKEVWNQL